MRLALIFLFALAGVPILPAQGGLPNPTPQGRKCYPAELPGEIPAGNEVVDSAALVGPLAHPAQLLLSLRFENNGRRPTVAVLESDRDSAVTESLRAAIQAAARAPSPELKAVWAIRLRVVGGVASSLTLEQSTFCPAEPRGGTPSAIVTLPARVDSTAVIDTSMRVPPAQREQVRLAATLRVSSTGEVTEVTMTTSSGQRFSDNQFAARWRRMRFFPALLDGVPVAVTYDTESEQSIP
jgi:hypothetical protein